MILSAVYMLWMFQRVYYGEVTNEHNREMPDLSFREWAIIGPLCAAAIFMGVFPNVFLKPMEPAVDRIVQRMRTAAAAAARASAAPVHPAAPSHLAPCTCRHPSAPCSHVDASFDAVIPVICVSPGRPGRRCSRSRSAARTSACRSAGLPIIGLVGAGDRVGVPAGIATPPASASSRADNFALFVNLVIVAVGILTVFFASQTIERDGLPAGEFYALMLFSIVGMMLMVQATDLLLLFLALETMSIAVYVLTGIRRDQPASTEAAFKYFLLGAFASSFFLYGIAFIYGVTGSTSLDRVGSVIAAQSMSGNPMILLAVGLLIVGFGFKVAAVPFHMWSPDAYEGAPAVVTGFMSTGVKAAAIAAFARVFLSALEPMISDWAPVLWVVAAATMIVGTVLGVAQTSLKRMLAYSSIAHGGYLLVGTRGRQRRRQGGDPLLPGGLRADQPRRVRRHRAARLARARQRRPARLRRALVLAPGAGHADDDLPAVARRLPADGGLHRQVVHLQRRDRLRLLLARDHRRPVERRLGLLLPAHRRDDVHVRARRASGARAAHRRSPWPASRSRSSASSISASCPRRSSISRRRRSRRFSKQSSVLGARFPTVRPKLRPAWRLRASRQPGSPGIQAALATMAVRCEAAASRFILDS